MGWPVAWKCAVAWLFGESSQQPIVPHWVQRRRWTQVLPIARQAAHTRTAGISLYSIVSRCPQDALTVRPFHRSAPAIARPLRTRYRRRSDRQPATVACTACDRRRPSDGRDESVSASCARLETMEYDEIPAVRVCAACIAMGSTWVHLRLCTQCGTMRTSFAEGPATAHFHATGHPIIPCTRLGEDWFWCYVDELTAPQLGSRCSGVEARRRRNQMPTMSAAPGRRHPPRGMFRSPGRSRGCCPWRSACAKVADEMPEAMENRDQELGKKAPSSAVSHEGYVQRSGRMSGQCPPVRLRRFHTDSAIILGRREPYVPGKFIIKLGPTGKFRFSLVSTNGQVVAQSQAYETKHAPSESPSVQKLAAGAKVRSTRRPLRPQRGESPPPPRSRLPRNRLRGSPLREEARCQEEVSQPGRGERATFSLPAASEASPRSPGRRVAFGSAAVRRRALRGRRQPPRSRGRNRRRSRRS